MQLASGHVSIMSVCGRVHISSIFCRRVLVLSKRNRTYATSAPVLRDVFSFCMGPVDLAGSSLMPDSWLTHSVTKSCCRVIVTQLVREIRVQCEVWKKIWECMPNKVERRGPKLSRALGVGRVDGVVGFRQRGLGGLIVWLHVAFNLLLRPPWRIQYV